MSRVQLARNVTDIDEAVDCYTRFFGTGPAKRRPGYANFAADSPPLKLVLIESADVRDSGVRGALNHLEVEVDTPDEVRSASDRPSGEGYTPDVQESTTCCYAVQNEAWVTDPDGAPWEVNTVLADAPDETGLGCSTEGCAPVDGSNVTAAAPSAGTATRPCC